MKKTLVALAVLAAAGQAQAIELYNADKVTVNMTGDVEVVYKKGLNDGAEFKQEIQDADFGFDTRYAMNDDLQVGAFWEFKGSDTNNSKGATVGDVYMGLYSQSVGSIKFGKQTTSLDDAGIGGDYQFGISSFFQNGTPFAGHEVVKYELDKGTFYGKIAYMQDKNGYNGLGNDGNFFDFKVGARVADFDFTGFFGQAKIKTAGKNVWTPDPDTGVPVNNPVADVDQKERIYALEARYAGVENLNLAAGYYGTEIDPAGDDKIKNQTFGLSGDYTLNTWTFGAGVSNTKFDGELDGKDNFTSWYVNAAYALAPSTKAYAEVGGNNFYSQDVNGDYADAKGNAYAKSQTGIAVGIKAEF